MSMIEKEKGHKWHPELDICMNCNITKELFEDSGLRCVPIKKVLGSDPYPLERDPKWDVSKNPGSK